MMFKTDNSCFNMMANGVVGMLITGALGSAYSAATGVVGARILTNDDHPIDANQLAKLGAVGGVVWSGSLGFFNAFGASLTHSMQKINIDTLPLHFIVSELIIALIGFALLHPETTIQDTILAFAIGSVVLAYPVTLATYLSRKCFCPDTIVEPEELKLSQYGSV